MGRRPVRRVDSETEETTRRPAGRVESAYLRRAERLSGMTSTQPQHFQWQQEGRVGIITLNRPERKNPLTFESYAELRDFFRALVGVREVRALVITGAGGNFCSGGDVHEIIGPLTRMT